MFVGIDDAGAGAMKRMGADHGQVVAERAGDVVHAPQTRQQVLFHLSHFVKYGDGAHLALLSSCGPGSNMLTR